MQERERSFYVRLPAAEWEALNNLAAAERRTAGDQAAVMLAEAVRKASSKRASTAMNDFIRAKTGRGTANE